MRTAALRITLLATLIPLLASQMAQALIVGSYNIRYDNRGDVETGDSWAQRAPVVASLIRFHRFEILGTQEVLHHQLTDLQTLLPAYAHYGRGREDGQEKGEHMAIFYREDLFELKDSGTFWLSPTPGEPSIGWDASLMRVCSWVKLERREGNRPLFVFNTHFDHRGTQARLESAKLILKSIKEIAGEGEVILTGDFNVNQTSESYRLLHDSGFLRDAYETTPERYALNGTANKFDANSYTENRIDHVFHTAGFQVVRYGILTDSYRTPVLAPEPVETTSPAFPGEVKFMNYRARLPSDHFPVLVEFR